MLAADPFPERKTLPPDKWNEYIARVMRQDFVYPLIASPKVDGIRGLTIDFGYVPPPPQLTTVVSRTLKPIRNPHVQRIIGALPPGFDGELVALDRDNNHSFHESSSVIMDGQGGENWIYYVLDYISPFARTNQWLDPNYPGGGKFYHRYEDRLACRDLALMKHINKHIRLLEYRVVNNANELMDYDNFNIERGFEGTCVRAPHSPYKFGRSTVKEGWLMKIKQFVDSEAVIIGYDELMRNQNEAKENELVAGLRRHTNKDGLIPGGTLGGLIVRDLKTGMEFGVGSGLNTTLRAELWKNHDKLIGRVIKYKHQPHGAFEKPRIPIFIGFRDKDDIGSPTNVPEVF